MKESGRVMVISAKVGAGHMRAAEALVEAFAERHGDIEVTNIEALEHTNAVFRGGFTSGYKQLASRAPSIWEFIYETMEKKAVDSKTKKLASFLDRLNSAGLLRTIRAFEPDAVVCTHYFAAEILGHRKAKGKISTRIYVVLTDYDIHTMWIQKGVDCYFVGSEEMKYALEAKGVGESDVIVTGIPISPVFAHARFDKAALRETLGAGPDVRTVLVAAGGFGLSNIGEIARLLLAECPDVQFLAVAGRNNDLEEALREAAADSDGRLIPFGFVDNMHELMAASDFIVTKSGGLTSSECLAMGLPMIIWNPIPGQEERNADYLLENGVALRANSAANLVFKVRKLAGEGERLEKMSEAARRLSRPDAAFRIAERVAADLA